MKPEQKKKKRDGEKKGYHLRKSAILTKKRAIRGGGKGKQLAGPFLEETNVSGTE